MSEKLGPDCRAKLRFVGMNLEVLVPISAHLDAGLAWEMRETYGDTLMPPAPTQPVPAKPRHQRPGRAALYGSAVFGLRLALTHGERRVVVTGDSRLVVDQVNGKSKTKHPGLRPLRAQAAQLLALFESWRVEWIPREENWRADALGRMLWA